MRLLFTLLGCLALAACSRSPAGISDWDVALQVASDAIIKGDTDRFLRSLDTAGIPPEKAEQLEDYFGKKWKGVPSHMTLIETKVVNANEAEELKRARRKDWPAEMQTSSTKWGVTPERVIIYEFKSEDSSAVWSVGSFRRNGAWFFTGAY